MVRLFIAVRLSEEAKSGISSITDQLQTRLRDPTLRWAKSDQYHLTLKFLGETPEDQIPEIEKTLTGIAAEMRVFALVLGRTGTFGEAARVRNAWVGMEGEVQALGNLVNAIGKGLEPLGFPSERRAYSPHITVVRTKRETHDAVKQKLATLVRELPAPQRIEFRVESFELMRSHLQATGAVYEELRRFPLIG